jgi:hypothetical protein
MARIKMNQPVRWRDGSVRTPRELLDSGDGEIEVIEDVGPRTGKPRRSVYVGLKTHPDYGVEVSGYVAPES